MDSKGGIDQTMNIYLLALLPDLSSLLFDPISVYVVTGLLLWVFAGLTYADRTHSSRKATALFWWCLGVVFIFGGVLPHWITGLIVLLMAGIDGAGRVRRGAYEGAGKSEQIERARRLK